MVARALVRSQFIASIREIERESASGDRPLERASASQDVFISRYILQSILSFTSLMWVLENLKERASAAAFELSFISVTLWDFIFPLLQSNFKYCLFTKNRNGVEEISRFGQSNQVNGHRFFIFSIK